MQALEFRREEARFVASAVASRLRPGSGASVGPLHFMERAQAPDLPTEEWIRVRTRLAGICGSDLATVEGRAARYFEPWITFPFVPGHEVVGTTEDGRRVVLEPVLGHATRGFEPPFDGAAQADGDDYRHLVGGDLEPGIQTGSCASTGGGWATEFVAHPSQLHAVPDDLSDEAAVMIEPVAGGVHAALRAEVSDGATVAVIGAGTMGLATVAALRHLTPAGTIIAGARHPHQKKLAAEFGADVVVDGDGIGRAVRRATGSYMIGPDLSGGADVVIDAVGTSDSLRTAIAITRPRGRVVLLGMPGKVSMELTALWHRETELVGAYTYGTEHLPDGTTRHSFDLAMDLGRSVDLGALVSATYPLDRYVDALDHAANAGRLGAVKVCFDLR